MEVIVMGAETVNWEAALADVDARIAKLEATREGILMILAQGGGSANTPGGGGGGSSLSQVSVEAGAFHGKSISEAAKTFLGMAKKKQSTQAIVEALEAGGLPRYKYTTVYSVLRRREGKVGDIVNENGDWRLKEWAPHYRKASTKAEDNEIEQPAPDKAQSA